MATESLDTPLQPSGVAPIPGGDSASPPAPVLLRVRASAERLLFERPLWQLLAAVLALDVVKSGISAVPNVDQWIKMARSFPNNPGPLHSSFILSSPMGPGLAHVLGMDSTGGYEILNALVVVAAGALLLLGLRRRGRGAAVVGLVALFASPLSSVLLTWLGQEDSFIFLFAVLAFFFDTPVWATVAGVGLGLSNPEAAVIIVAATALLRLAPDYPRSGSGSAMLGVGLGLGLLLCAAYDAHIGAPFLGRVSYLQSEGFLGFSRMFLGQLPALAFSGFGAWWLALVVLWKDVGPRVLRRGLAGVLVVAAAVTFVTVDETRIFTLLTLPVLLWSAVRIADRSDPATVRRMASWVFLAAAVIPRTVVWAGTTHVSSVYGFLLNLR